MMQGIAARFAVLIRIALGCIFLVSSFDKIADPDAFAGIVANYQLLPSSLVALTALIFPWIEVVCGLALVVGRLDKGAALLVSLMMVVFIGLILYNGYRGLDIACGCFSVTATEPSSIMMNSVRNTIILAGSVWILCLPAKQRIGAAR
jgi:uncharacterized membrane protein YphA (DoxX/SURF4 family)